MNTHLKLVILDRDGTINQASEEFVKSPEEWHPLPGALEAISRLNHAGFHVVLATNQSGMGFSIAKQLTEDMGGSLTYESNVTVGNYFKLKFKLA